MPVELIEVFLLIGIMVLLFVSEIWVNSAFHKYSKMETNLPLTGKDIVDNMLNGNGIHDVAIGHTSGNLDDHYNPRSKTINLSKKGITTNSVAAIAVAAHETGHAIQDNQGYFMLKIRKFLAPITMVCSRFVWIVIFIGVIVQVLDIIVFGLILMGVTILFQLVTLPVEFDASRRAVAYLKTVGYDEYTMESIEKMLKAAAFTYVASTMAALFQMIRLILSFSRDD